MVVVAVAVLAIIAPAIMFCLWFQTRLPCFSAMLAIPSAEHCKKANTALGAGKVLVWAKHSASVQESWTFFGIPPAVIYQLRPTPHTSCQPPISSPTCLTRWQFCTHSYYKLLPLWGCDKDDGLSKQYASSFA